MENGEHDNNMSSSLSSSLLHMNPAGAPLAKMKAIISSANHGLTNRSAGLSKLNGRKVSANPTEGLIKGLSNHPRVNEIHAVTPCGLYNNPSEDVMRVPASLDPKERKPPAIVYRECLKNHAAHIGAHATDGCGEFIPGGADGTLEALACSACHCHRNFHRRETEGELASCSKCVVHGSFMDHGWMDVQTCAFPSRLPLSSPTLHSAHMIRAGIDMDADDFGCGRIGPMSPSSPASLKKRFRTKFTEEQKERMAAFAEALGWRMQKQDEAVVGQFCMEIGVKRQVFKVWVHNNKLAVGKKVPCLTMTPDKVEV